MQLFHKKSLTLTHSPLDILPKTFLQASWVGFLVTVVLLTTKPFTGHTLHAKFGHAQKAKFWEFLGLKVTAVLTSYGKLLFTFSPPLQGCALRKIEGSPVLWTCEIQCAQHMISMKKQRFSSRPRTTLRRHGPQGSTRAQPLALFFCFSCLFLFLLGV